MDLSRSSFVDARKEPHGAAPAGCCGGVAEDLGDLG